VADAVQVPKRAKHLALAAKVVCPAEAVSVLMVAERSPIGRARALLEAVLAVGAGRAGVAVAGHVVAGVAHRAGADRGAAIAKAVRIASERRK
jgi:hypothetical protein